MSELIRRAAIRTAPSPAPAALDPSAIQQMVAFVRAGFQQAAATGRPANDELADLQREAVRLAGGIAGLAAQLEVVLTRAAHLSGSERSAA